MMAGKITRYNSTGNTVAAIRSTALKCTKYCGIDNSKQKNDVQIYGHYNRGNQLDTGAKAKISTGNDAVAGRSGNRW